VNMHGTAAAMRHSLRRRTTKLLLCTAGTAAVAAMAMASPAAAMVGPVGTGNPVCNAGYNGTMTFSPALVNGGTATLENVTLKTKFAGCSGGTPTPTTGVYTAKGVVEGTGANNCANWFTVPLGTPPLVLFNDIALHGPVTWTPASISPSTVSFARMRIYTGGGGHLFVRLSPNGSVVTGSYASVNTANLDLRTAQNHASVTAGCGTGVPFLTIVPANPTASTGTW
jgi:hypothetical protein